ncbi:MAG: hypothetical protein QXM08_00340 [Thermofilaceae archaeon]
MNLGRRAGLGLALVPLILVLTAAVAASDRWFYNGSIYISYFYGDGSGIEDWVFTGEGYYLSYEATGYRGYYGWYSISGVLDWKYRVILQPSGSYSFMLYMIFTPASEVFSVPPGTSRFYVFDEFYGEVDFSTRTLRVFCGGYEWTGTFSEHLPSVNIFVRVSVHEGPVDESGSVVEFYDAYSVHYIPCGFERFIGRELSLSFESTEMIHQLWLAVYFTSLSSSIVLVVPESVGVHIVPKDWSPPTCECPEQSTTSTTTQSPTGGTTAWLMEDKRLLAVIGGAVVLLLLLGLAAGRRRR